MHYPSLLKSQDRSPHLAPGLKPLGVLWGQRTAEQTHARTNRDFGVLSNSDKYDRTDNCQYNLTDTLKNGIKLRIKSEEKFQYDDFHFNLSEKTIVFFEKLFFFKDNRRKFISI